MLRPAILAILLALPLAAAPTVANAAEADVALIQSYAGDWVGAGRFTGAEEGNLECRLTMKSNGAKLFYNGRCAIDGQGSQNFQGAIAYNDAARRYEARSGGSPTVIGKKSGGNIVFSFTDEDRRGTVQSTITLAGNAIRLAFTLTDAKTKEVTKAQIPFRKS